MKNLLRVLLLLISFITIAGEPSIVNKAEAEASSKSELTEQQVKNIKYYAELNQFLLNSNDIKIQLSAFSSHHEINKDFTKIRTSLKQAINTSSDAYTLFLAVRLCHNTKALTAWCHRQNIHQIHYQVDPDNFFTYLFDLHTDDSELVIQNTIFQAAQSSTYADSFFFEYIIEFAQQLDIFNAENPELFADYFGLNDSENLNHINDLHNKIASLKLIEKGLASPDYKKKIIGNTSITAAIGIELARAMSYNQLTRFCRESIDAGSCLLIGKLMKKEGVFMDQMIGISLIHSAQQTMVVDNDTLLDNKKREHEYNMFSCYSLVPDMSYTLMVNKKIATQYVLDAKEFGEFEAVKKMAFTVYAIEKEHGFNPGFNPKECE